MTAAVGQCAAAASAFAVRRMTFTVLIPARLQASRLPDKPLADIGGLPMVVRVAQLAARSSAQRVVVAADHARILAACAAHDVEAVATSPQHPSGSDRLAEAAALLGLADDAIVVNVQGDEPLLDPALIDAVAQLLVEQPDAAISTAAHEIHTLADFLNPNVVKVVLDRRSRALTFSRAPIPHWRDAPPSPAPGPAGFDHRPLPAPLRHIGLYGYRAHFLKTFPTLAPAPLEQCEALEQLRALWHGFAIAVHLTPHAPGPGVDTPEDLARVRALFN